MILKILRNNLMDKIRSQFVPNQKKQNKHLLPTIKKPLLGKGFNDDSDWAQTSDLYPVKVDIWHTVSITNILWCSLVFFKNRKKCYLFIHLF
ncbi:hypothetical protein DEJ56_04760 [Bacillus altitudinis]|nr:hypothetical protein DEJ56_04760 [Bacillus altitudinis]